MIRWVDVNENDWFFHEVNEASNYLLEDGQPLISSHAYNEYLADAPYLYEEQDGVKGQKLFTLTKKVVPTKDNPLFVYIDGSQTMYKSCITNSAGTSDVEFYVAPPAGATVSFTSVGKPTANRFGKPSVVGGAAKYPNHKLQRGDTYYYEPLSRQYQEYLYAFGRKLYRVDVPDNEWGIQDPQDVATKYIGNKTDRYIVSPALFGGYLFVPFNLHGVTCKFTYNSLEDGVVIMRGGDFKDFGENVLFNNRFFPKAYITRQEAISMIDRLRKTFFSRFTDSEAPTNKLDQTFVTYEGQRGFNLNGRINSAGTGVAVYLDGALQTKGTHYTIINDHAIVWNIPLVAGRTVRVTYTKYLSDRFADVGRATSMYDTETTEVIQVSGTDEWWQFPVLALENERLKDGSYLIEGISITAFQDGAVKVDHMYNPIDGTDPSVVYYMPRTLLKRADAVSMLNRLRKWSIEKFK